MIVGIMQPYFVPYIAYWQLINAVDKFVVYDDVNYIKGGWINRNRILVHGEPTYFNVQLRKASPNKKINTIEVEQSDVLVRKNLTKIELAYSKAPYFDVFFPVIEAVLKCNEKTISRYNAFSLQMISKYLNIDTEFIFSSQLCPNYMLQGEDRVIDICKKLGATDYYNSIGGQLLYSYDNFKVNNIDLHFIKTNEIKYQQFNYEFQNNLSIVDICMFVSKERVREFLTEYSLIH